ncbi:Alpha/Beta hydrolase protein [Dendryphion nanum]|uniref:Alpha/Beta hydrolase protein n=1 Tax=Dendryphion nanum TaxID=256645 RepID=A0A9P9DD00_9PLEO|nr:Alpha/Beta hydrolase protein [Dendryphion nanum]
MSAPTILSTKTLSVPYLSTTVSYATPSSQSSFASNKPTLVFINSFSTTSSLYAPQFANKELCAAANLIAIEPLGHGGTKTPYEHWTYWDSAHVNLQVLEGLGVEKAFVLGTSQGGWVAVRMALLGGSKVQGVIALGTSMDYESPRSVEKGCWDAVTLVTPTIHAFTSATPTPDFVAPDQYAEFLCSSGFGDDCARDVVDFWRERVQEVYRGDEGRKKIRSAAIALRDRDGLRGRVGDVKCRVLWMHGTQDMVYSYANAEEEIELFTAAEDARLVKVEGGKHFLSASNPVEVTSEVIKFLRGSSP